MRIEINYWSATFYCRNEDDLRLLFLVYDWARERHCVCAAVNVLANLLVLLRDKELSLKLPPEKASVVEPYVWVAHFDEKDVLGLLEDLTIPMKLVEVVEIPFDTPDFRKRLPKRAGQRR